MTYPIFKNPTLKEALCEIRFKPLSEDINKRMLTDLVALFSSEYPLSDVIDESPFQFNIGGQSIVPERVLRYKFSSDSSSYAITVKKNAFAFVLNPSEQTSYRKEIFYEKVCKEWKRFSEKFSITNVERIGIRFVNVLEINKEDLTNQYFSEESKYFSSHGLNSNQYYFNRAEFSLDEKNKLIVMAASQPSRNSANKKELVLDIDRIVEDYELLSNVVDSRSKTLHQDIEEAFFGSITEAYKSVMEPVNANG